MPGPAEPDLSPLKRNFSMPAPTEDVPAAVAAGRTQGAPGRDLWLRVTMFAMLLGAVMTLLYAWFLARPDVGALPGAGLASFQRVLVPIVAVAAVVGVLVLERAAVLGVVLLIVSTGLGLAGGGVWLVPGAVLGCIWAARRRAAARATVGILLLVPSLAAVYYGLIGGIGFALGEPVHGLPPALAQPLTLGQALSPLEFLPLALLGAWLLVRPLGSHCDLADSSRPH